MKLYTVLLEWGNPDRAPYALRKLVVRADSAAKAINIAKASSFPGEDEPSAIKTERESAF